MQLEFRQHKKASGLGLTQTLTLTLTLTSRAFLKNVFPEFKVKFLKQSFPLCLGSF